MCWRERQTRSACVFEICMTTRQPTIMPRSSDMLDCFEVTVSKMEGLSTHQYSLLPDFIPFMVMFDPEIGYAHRSAS